MADLFTRSDDNPVISPNPNHPWEALKVFNPGAIYHEGKYHLFYRASGGGPDWHSALGHAVSADGVHFERFDEPLLDRDPSNPLEFRGLEDPRVTKIGDIFYMAYAAYDGLTPRLCIATSTNLVQWDRHPPAFHDFNFMDRGGIVTQWKDGKASDGAPDPKNNELSKAGGIFPEKIDGKYWMLFNEFRVWLANSDDGIKWTVLPDVFIAPRTGTDLFDNVFVEMGPPPIKTDKGWLVLYHGVNDAIQYHLGIILLDLADPTKILYRADEPVFGPREKYELSGIVDIIPGVIDLLAQGKEAELKALLQKAEHEGFMPQVTFTTAALVVDDIVRLYYGASDEFICTATAPLADVLSTILPRAPQSDRRLSPRSD